MIALDTSFLYALLDAREPKHAEAKAWYGGVAEALVTTPLVLAETDYFAARAGAPARGAFLRDVATGAYDVFWWTEASRESVEVAERYPDLGISLTDGSLVALAARLETVRIATFDERHFRPIRPLSGAPAFTLLPADA